LIWLHFSPLKIEPKLNRNFMTSRSASGYYPLVKGVLSKGCMRKIGAINAKAKRGKETAEEVRMVSIEPEHRTWLPEYSWQDINEPGAYVEVGEGDLYRVPKEVLIYDYEDVIAGVLGWDYIMHLRKRREPASEVRPEQKHSARRWMVERTHAWYNKFRRLLVPNF
jgi:hypothetical protein